MGEKRKIVESPSIGKEERQIAAWMVLEREILSAVGMWL